VFVGPTPLCIAATRKAWGGTTGNIESDMTLRWHKTVTSGAARSYTIRTGGGGGGYALNGDGNSATQRFGGVAASSLIVTEKAP